MCILILKVHQRRRIRSRLKKAEVRPLYKKDGRKDKSNCRHVHKFNIQFCLSIALNLRTLQMIPLLMNVVKIMLR